MLLFRLYVNAEKIQSTFLKQVQWRKGVGLFGSEKRILNMIFKYDFDLINNEI
jgi:hypothetical protein